LSGAPLYQHRVSKSALQVSSMPETPIAIYSPIKFLPRGHSPHDSRRKYLLPIVWQLVYKGRNEAGVILARHDLRRL